MCTLVYTSLESGPLTISSGNEQVGSRELRSSLAEYLRSAAAGHTIVVTVDGSPMAQLGPIGQSEPGLSIAPLIAAGLLEPPSRFDRQPSEATFDLPAGLSSERALREIRGR